MDGEGPYRNFLATGYRTQTVFVFVNSRMPSGESSRP